MTADERTRFLATVDAIDAAAAARPDILASPVGFVLGALVSAARSDPEGTWRQVAGFADVLAYLVTHVQTGQGTPDALIAALLPVTEPTGT